MSYGNSKAIFFIRLLMAERALRFYPPEKASVVRRLSLRDRTLSVLGQLMKYCNLLLLIICIGKRLLRFVGEGWLDE